MKISIDNVKGSDDKGQQAKIPNQQSGSDEACFIWIEWKKRSL